MSSFTCEGEACWAAGWLQHSFTVSSNVTAEQLVNVAAGLEGPLTHALTPDSFPTRYVPFNPTIIAIFFVLIVLVLLHEIYATYRKPILASHEQSSTVLAQTAFMMVRVQSMIFVAMVVPVSLDFCLQMGQSATMSGFWLSSPLFGAIIGVMIGKGLTSETDWNQVFARRLLVITPLVATFCILGMGYLTNTAGDRSLEERRKTYWISFLVLQVQTIISSMGMLPMNVMQNKMTPNSEKTFWMVMAQSAQNAGLLLGPGLFGILAYAVKGGEEVSPASLYAWVQLSLAIIWAIMSLFNSWVLPTVLIPPEEDAPSPKGEEGHLETDLSLLPTEKRARVVYNLMWFGLERPFSISAIEVGSIMLLEVSYGWATESSGTIFSVVSGASLVFSLISNVLLSHGVTESAIFLGANCLGLLGVIFLFDFGTGPAGLLLADGMVYGMTSVCNGIAEGWTSKAAVEDTEFSVEQYRVQTALAMSVARFLSPIVTRMLMDFGGRNLYATMQFLLVTISTLTVYQTVKMVWDDTKLQGKVKGVEKGLAVNNDT